MKKMQVKETPYYKKDLFDFRVPFKHELKNHLQKQRKNAHFYIFDWIKAGGSQVYPVSFSSYKQIFFSSRSHLHMFLHVCLLLWPVSGFFKAFKTEPGETVHHVPFKKNTSEALSGTFILLCDPIKSLRLTLNTDHCRADVFKADDTISQSVIVSRPFLTSAVNRSSLCKSINQTQISL